MSIVEGSLGPEAWEVYTAARAEQEAKRASAEAALAVADHDYLAMEIELFFGVEIVGCDAEMEGGHDPELWELADDPAENTAAIAQVVKSATAAISPWVTHYRSISLLRGDDLPSKMLDDCPAEPGPTCFYLIYEAKDAALKPCPCLSATSRGRVRPSPSLGLAVRE